MMLNIKKPSKIYNHSIHYTGHIFEKFKHSEIRITKQNSFLYHTTSPGTLYVLLRLSGNQK